MAMAPDGILWVRRQNFIPEGQGFKTAGMCLVDVGVSGQLEASTREFSGTTAFPQPKIMNLKINLSDPHMP